MNDEQHNHLPHASGCNIPDDAILYRDCGCKNHEHHPEKIGTFNIETNTLSVAITGEF
jgi:hypothetical protein